MTLAAAPLRSHDPANPRAREFELMEQFRQALFQQDRVACVVYELLRVKLEAEKEALIRSEEPDTQRRQGAAQFLANIIREIGQPAPAPHR